MGEEDDICICFRIFLYSIGGDENECRSSMDTLISFYLVCGGYGIRKVMEGVDDENQ